MFFCFKDSSDTGYVVVVNERVEMFATVKAPVFTAELTLNGVRDFKHIHIVETRKQSLVTFVIRYGIEHFGVHPSVIVAVERFDEQEEIIRKPLAVTVQCFQEILVEAVGPSMPNSSFQPVMQSLIYCLTSGL